MISPPCSCDAADELLGDVAPVEAVVGGVDRLLAALARGERLLLRLHQLAQRRRRSGWRNLARLRRLARLAGVGQEHRLEYGHSVDPLLLPLDGVRELRLDRIAVGHLDRGRQHVLQAQAAVLGQHHHQPARSARRDRRERAVLGRVGHALRLEELRRGARRRDAEGVDADDLLRARVVDQGLRLAAPAERVPHGAGGGEHGAGGVHGVAALLEHHGARGGAQRLARDRHPVPAVQHRLDRARRLRVGGGHGQRAEERRVQENENARSHVRPPVQLVGRGYHAPATVRS